MACNATWWFGLDLARATKTSRATIYLHLSALEDAKLIEVDRAWTDPNIPVGYKSRPRYKARVRAT